MPIAEITHQQGEGISGRVYFRMRSVEEITIEQIEEAQRRAGYHPKGYGCFIDPKALNTRDDGLYQAHWSCATSCS